MVLLGGAAVSTTMVGLRVVVSDLSRDMLLHDGRGDLSSIGRVTAGKVGIAVKVTMVRNS